MRDTVRTFLLASGILTITFGIGLIGLTPNESHLDYLNSHISDVKGAFPSVAGSGMYRKLGVGIAAYGLIACITSRVLKRDHIEPNVRSNSG